MKHKTYTAILFLLFIFQSNNFNAYSEKNEKTLSTIIKENKIALTLLFLGSGIAILNPLIQNHISDFLKNKVSDTTINCSLGALTFACRGIGSYLLLTNNKNKKKYLLLLVELISIATPYCCENIEYFNSKKKIASINAFLSLCILFKNYKLYKSPKIADIEPEPKDPPKFKIELEKLHTINTFKTHMIAEVFQNNEDIQNQQYSKIIKHINEKWEKIIKEFENNEKLKNKEITEDTINEAFFYIKKQHPQKKECDLGEQGAASKKYFIATLQVMKAIPDRNLKKNNKEITTEKTKNYSPQPELLKKEIINEFGKDEIAEIIRIEPEPQPENEKLKNIEHRKESSNFNLSDSFGRKNIKIVHGTKYSEIKIKKILPHDNSDNNSIEEYFPKTSQISEIQKEVQEEIINKANEVNAGISKGAKDKTLNITKEAKNNSPEPEPQIEDQPKFEIEPKINTFKKCMIAEVFENDKNIQDEKYVNIINLINEEWEKISNECKTNEKLKNKEITEDTIDEAFFYIESKEKSSKKECDIRRERFGGHVDFDLECSPGRNNMKISDGALFKEAFIKKLKKMSLEIEEESKKVTSHKQIDTISEIKIENIVPHENLDNSDNDSIEKYFPKTSQISEIKKEVQKEIMNKANETGMSIEDSNLYNILYNYIIIKLEPHINERDITGKKITDMKSFLIEINNYLEEKGRGEKINNTEDAMKIVNSKENDYNKILAELSKKE